MNSGNPLGDLMAMLFAMKNGTQPEGYVPNSSPMSQALGQYPAASPQQPAPAVATPTTQTVPPPATDPMDPSKMDTMAAMLSSVQTGEPNRVPLPMTPNTEIPRSLNPQFAQMVLQQLMGANTPMQQRTLGQIFGGQ